MSRAQSLTQEAPGYLYNVTRNVGIADQDRKKAVQDELDQLVGLYSVLNAMKLFKTFLPQAEWTHSCPDPQGQTARLVEADTLERLLAYNYIRNIAAHGIDGSRKDEHGNIIGGNLAEFEAIMNSATLIPGVTADADFVTISPATLFADMQNFLVTTTQYAMAHSGQYHS